SELRLIPTKKPISQRLIGFLFAESGGQFSNSLYEDLKALEHLNISINEKFEGSQYKE
ncbi:MAG: hypothetical protein ACI8ZM_004135, partial [Crocinitomix sp.]